MKKQIYWFLNSLQYISVTKKPYSKRSKDYYHTYSKYNITCEELSKTSKVSTYEFELFGVFRYFYNIPWNDFKSCKMSRVIENRMKIVIALEKEKVCKIKKESGLKEKHVYQISFQKYKLSNFDDLINICIIMLN